MSRYRCDPFGRLRPQVWAPKDNDCQAYKGFESKASLLNVKRSGAWLRLRTFAEELEAEHAKAAAIRANPFLGVAPLRFRTMSNQHYRAPLVTWPLDSVGAKIYCG